MNGREERQDLGGGLFFWFDDDVLWLEDYTGYQIDILPDDWATIAAAVKKQQNLRAEEHGGRP